MKQIKIRLKSLNQSGVTLIETLTVMGLMSILLVILASIFTSAADVQKASNSYSSTETTGRFIIARLNYDISEAMSVTIPTSIGVSSPTLTISIYGTAYTYAMSGSNLQLNDGVTTDNLNSDDVTVSGLSFQEYSDGMNKPTIQYTFTVTSVAVSHGTKNSQTYSGTAGLR